MHLIWMARAWKQFTVQEVKKAKTICVKVQIFLSESTEIVYIPMVVCDTFVTHRQYTQVAG